MALALNLRGDLAKLSDAELAERLHAAWAKHDASRKYPRWSFRPSFSFRWPLRHPRVYRFLSAMEAMGSGSGHWIDLLFPLVMSSKLTDALVDATGDEYLILCEIRDITDEIERRVNSRKGKGV
jgi:hypothetical protein